MLDEDELLGKDGLMGRWPLFLDGGVSMNIEAPQNKMDLKSGPWGYSHPDP